VGRVERSAIGESEIPFNQKWLNWILMTNFVAVFQMDNRQGHPMEMNSINKYNFLWHIRNVKYRNPEGISEGHTTKRQRQRWHPALIVILR